jgi:hypothetical protein
MVFHSALIGCARPLSPRFPIGDSGLVVPSGRFFCRGLSARESLCLSHEASLSLRSPGLVEDRNPFRNLGDSSGSINTATTHGSEENQNLVLTSFYAHNI